MELVGGKEWSFEALAVPQMGHVPSTEIDNPITMDNFLSSACRRCEGVRSATLMFDFRGAESAEVQDLDSDFWSSGSILGKSGS